MLNPLTKKHDRSILTYTHFILYVNANKFTKDKVLANNL
ncbi:hypothetical protein III_05963 [Bacillus mycoides]|uniref:Uncharacterized protein n=1 Tax=Bacillus mycoides TaxID=1405 RepID=A0ABC9QUP0_BACMY|nr:hypothetical protein III_05963 [Bacillus mycoides]